MEEWKITPSRHPRCEIMPQAISTEPVRGPDTYRMFMTIRRMEGREDEKAIPQCALETRRTYRFMMN